jgi:hypothetical protein
MGIAGLLCLAAASASATSVTVQANNGNYAACPSGTTGVLTTNSAGGIDVVFAGTDNGCYIGDSGVTGTPSTYIGSLTGEGTASGLNSLSTGWYAEYGAMCDATGSCNYSSSSTNGSGSADFDVLINRTGSTMTFQIYNSSNTIDGAGNSGIAGPTGQCSYTVTSGQATFTVAANSICFENLSTGASIAIDVNTPTATPEVATMLLVATGLFLMALVGRRMSSRTAMPSPKSGTVSAMFHRVAPLSIGGPGDLE